MTFFVTNFDFNIYSYPFTNMAVTAGSWFSCVITIDRFVAVKNRQETYKFIKKNLYGIIFILVLASVILHIPRFFEFYPVREEINQEVMRPSLSGVQYSSLNQNHFYNVLSMIINSAFTTVIPLLVIAVFGFILITNFINFQKSGVHLRRRGKVSSCHREKMALTTKLALLSIGLFTCLAIISVIMIGVSGFDPTFFTKGSASPFLNTMKHINNFLINLRSSVNFILFCISCSQYRASLKNLFCHAGQHRNMPPNYINYQPEINRARTMALGLEEYDISPSTCNLPKPLMRLPEENSLELNQLNLNHIEEASPTISNKQIIRPNQLFTGIDLIKRFSLHQTDSSKSTPIIEAHNE